MKNSIKKENIKSLIQGVAIMLLTIAIITAFQIFEIFN